MSCRSSIPRKRPCPTTAAPSFARPEGERTLGRRPRADAAAEPTSASSPTHRAEPGGDHASHRLVVPGASYRPTRRRAASDPDHASARHGQRLPVEAGCRGRLGGHVMSFGPLAFLSPWLLAGLLALPVIWWLLRTIPPRPRQPGLSADPHSGRAWRTTSRPRRKRPGGSPSSACWPRRLIILALAEPVLNANRERALTGTGPVIIAVDNTWAAAAHWAERTRALDRFIAEAEGAEPARDHRAHRPGEQNRCAQGRAPAAARSTAAASSRSPLPPIGRRRWQLSPAALAGAAMPARCGSADGIDHDDGRRSLPKSLRSLPAVALAVHRQRRRPRGARPHGRRRCRRQASMRRCCARAAAARGMLHAFSARGQRLGETLFKFRARRDARAGDLRSAARAQEPGDARRDRGPALRRRRQPARCALAMAPGWSGLGRLARAGPALTRPALLHRAGAAALLGDRQERRCQSRYLARER